MATSSDDMAAASVTGSGGKAQSPASSSSKPRKERTSMCSYCGMTFNKKEHLQRHERTHTLDRPYHCDFAGCGKAFARRDTLTRHTRLHQRDEIQGSLKLPLGHGLDDDDETSEAFTTPSGSKQVSPATSGSTAPGPVSAAVLTGGKGKKATHSRTGSIASQKSSKRAHGSKGPSSQPNSKKNTPEYKTADDDARPSATPTVTAVRSRPRRAAAAALYDENALMDDDLSSSEQDEMQEDSPNNQDHMVIPNEGKPDLHQVNSALAPAVVIGQQQQNSGHVKVEDMIKPLLPSLHTSSYLARSLEAQHNQGIPHIKSGRPTSVPATAIAGLNQPIYNFASWDQGNTYPGNNQQKSTLLANSNNPNLLGYSSSANSSGSSSGSAYNSSHSHLGSGGSASLASPYSNQTQGTPGSALGLDLGLPPTPSVPILPTPEEVQHFQGFNFPGSNSNNASCPPDSIGDQQQQQQYRLPPYSSGQQSSYETFPSFQGPNLTHHHQRASSTVSAAAAAGNFYHGSTTTTGSQGYTNQSSSPTAAQSFLARSPSGAHPPHLSQRHSASSISTSVPSGAVRSSYSTSSTPLAPMNSFSAENGMGGNYRKKAPSFVPSFWAHMTVQHQEPSTSSAATLSLNHQQHQRELYAQMQHHRSNASSRFSPTDDGFELLSNHSDTNSPVTAPSSLLAINSPTLTTGMNLYSLTSPGSEISSLPSLSSSFSSAFSGDFLRDGSIVTPSNNGVVDGGDPNVAFKHRGSFMEPLLNLNKNMGASTLEINMNAAILKAADAHTDQFINWPERDASPFTWDFPGLSPENGFSAPSVITAHSPSSATSYLDFSEYDTTATQVSNSSLFGGDNTFTIPVEIALQSSNSHGKFGNTCGDLNTGAFGRQSPVSNLEDWLVRQTPSNEYVF